MHIQESTCDLEVFSPAVLKTIQLLVLTATSDTHTNNDILLPVSAALTRLLSDRPLNSYTLTFPMDLNLLLCMVSLTLIIHSHISHVLWQLAQRTRPPLLYPPPCPCSLCFCIQLFVLALSHTRPSCLACSKCRLVQCAAGIPPGRHLGPSVGLNCTLSNFHPLILCLILTTLLFLPPSFPSTLLSLSLSLPPAIELSIF